MIMTIPSFALELAYCPGKMLKVPSGSAQELKLVMNNLLEPKGNFESTRIVCGHSKYGNYLYDKNFNKSFRISSVEACKKIEHSLLIMAKELKSPIGFEVDFKTDSVLSVGWSKVWNPSDCGFAPVQPMEVVRPETQVNL